MDGAGVHRDASEADLDIAVPEEDSPPDATPAKRYQQIYGEISPLFWVFLGVFLLPTRINLSHKAVFR